VTIYYKSVQHMANFVS